MFGFIRPLRPELKLRELERFQSVYCGLCHSLRSRYGPFYSMFLSFDCTYLAVVLGSAYEEEGAVCRRRCIASPLKKKCVLCSSAAVDRAADVSIILTYRKLEDNIRDETGWKKLAARILRLWMMGGYKKARSVLPAFDQCVGENLAKLSGIEEEQAASVDRPADTFGKILESAVPQTNDRTERVLREMFYHTGRFIYLIDACYDLKEDFESGNYNPVRLRYRLETPDLSDVREEIAHTLTQSLAASYHAFSLLDVKRDKGIIENILCMGMPVVLKQVLDGTYTNNGGRIRYGSI